MVRSKHAKTAMATLAAGITFTLQFFPTLSTIASDHIDSPTVTQDRGADIGDAWSFLDPNDNSKVVIVMTTQNFMTPGEAPNKAIFDHNIRYRVEVENTGDAAPDRFIDVHFTRGVGRGEPQTATISLPNGRSFKAQTTVATLEDTPPQQVVATDSVSGVSFFAGQTEDPFFLDNAALGRYAGSAAANPGKPDKNQLLRGRDTYAGYNVLAISLRVPVDLLKSNNTDILGINTLTQRQRNQIVLENGEVKGVGPWITVDRDGGPAANNLLIPASRKNEYNAATTVDDANGKFQADIIASLRTLGTNDTFINRYLDLFVRRGDYMRLNLSIPNSGPQGGNNPEAAFPNGRRLADDTMDTLITLTNNGQTLGDSVNSNELRLQDSFPFVGAPYQPLPSGVVDDGTRN
jgi:hypothetical protein